MLQLQSFIHTLKTIHFGLDFRYFEEILDSKNRYFGTNFNILVLGVLDLISQVILKLIEIVNKCLLSYPENPGVPVPTTVRLLRSNFNPEHLYSFLNETNSTEKLSLTEIILKLSDPYKYYDLWTNRFSENRLLETLTYFDGGLKFPDQNRDLPENYVQVWSLRDMIFNYKYLKPHMFFGGTHWQFPELYKSDPLELSLGQHAQADEQAGYVEYLNPMFDIDLKDWKNETDVREHLQAAWSYDKDASPLHRGNNRNWRTKYSDTENFVTKTYQTRATEDIPPYDSTLWKRILNLLFGYKLMITEQKNMFQVNKPMILSYMSGKDIRSEEIYYETFEFLNPGRIGMIMLPDQVSNFLQTTFNFTNTELPFHCMHILNTYIAFYLELIGIRYLLAWFIVINPYQNFVTSLLVTSVDWVENLFGTLPTIIYGIPITIPIVMAVLNYLYKIKDNILLTFPYLPSEAKIKYLADDHIYTTHKYLMYEHLSPWDRFAIERNLSPINERFMARKVDLKDYHPFIFENLTRRGDLIYDKSKAWELAPGDYTLVGGQGHAFLKFEGLPKLWLKNGIPNNLRTYWFWERPTAFKEFYNQFEEARLESGVQLLPDYVIKDLKSNVPNLNLSDLSKMPIEDLYEFLFGNLSQNLMADLMKQLVYEFQVLDVNISDYLNDDTRFCYQNLLENFNPTNFDLISYIM